MYYTQDSKQQHRNGHNRNAREHDASGDCINERHDLYSFAKNYHIETHWTLLVSLLCHSSHRF
jgi:hypothetical protein